MTFMPGKSGNPLGRPKKIDPRSMEMQEFCKQHQQQIKRVGEIALERAVEGQEPWAIKLCMDYFYYKRGVHTGSTTEKATEINLNLTNFSSNLSHEDQQTFLKLWMKSKRGTPAFISIADNTHEETFEAGTETVNQ